MVIAHHYKFQIVLPSYLREYDMLNPEGITVDRNPFHVSFKFGRFGDCRVQVSSCGNESPDVGLLVAQVRREIAGTDDLLQRADEICGKGLLSDGRIYALRKQADYLVGEQKVVFSIADNHVAQPFRIVARRTRGSSPTLLADKYKELPEIASLISVGDDPKQEDRICAEGFRNTLTKAVTLWELADVFTEIEKSLRKVQS